MAEMAESLDFITIIAYGKQLGMKTKTKKNVFNPIYFVLDLHGAWENVTVHPSPLYTTVDAKGQEKSISVVSGLQLID